MAQQHIAVLGAGHIGGTLGRKWATAGEQVVFGVSDLNGTNAQSVRADLGAAARVGSPADALRDAEVAVLAVPGTAMDATSAAQAAALDGKIVIDVANRLSGGLMNSLATLQRLTPRARVYRAFNTLGWENYADPLFNGTQADLFYCGAETDAATVEQLITEIGLRPVRVGDTDQIDVVDGIVRLYFALAVSQQRGRHLAFKLLT